MRKFIIPVLLAIALVFALNSGGRVLGPLSNLVEVEKGFSEKEAIRLSIKTLSPEESKKYLTQDVTDLGYMPVQLTIENRTADPYSLSPDSIGIHLADAEEVADKIVRKSMPRAIIFRVAGLIFWPLSIPGTISSLMTTKSRNDLERNLSAKSVKEEVIPPYSTLNRIFFVPINEYQGDYEISLQNLEDLSSRIFYIEGEERLTTLDPLPVVEENYYLTHES